MFTIIKQLVDHYDAKIEKLERQITNRPELAVVSTVDNRSACLMPVPAHEKRVRNSQKSLKQAATHSSVQSKKSQGHPTLPVDRDDLKQSPLLSDIEAMLGLADETPQPNVVAPKQTSNPNNHKDRKPTVLPAHASHRPHSKENLQPISRHQHMAPPSSVRPASASGVPKPKKKKTVPTSLAIRNLDREIQKVNSKLEVQTSHSSHHPSNAPRAVKSLKRPVPELSLQPPLPETSDIIDINASMQKQVQENSNDLRLQSLLTNLEGLTPAGLEHLMACSSSTRFVDVSDDASCISEPGQSNLSRLTSPAANPTRQATSKHKRKGSAVQMAAGSLNRNKSLVESLSQTSVLTQKRLLSGSVSTVQLQEGSHLTEPEPAPAIFVQKSEAELPQQRIDSYDLLMHQMMTLTKQLQP